MEPDALELNRIIAGIKEPAWRLNNDKIFIKLNRKGAILHVWGVSTSAYEGFAPFLQDQKSIFDVFNFGKMKTLDPVKDRTPFELRPEVPQDMIAIEEFNTDVPMAGIRLFRIDRETFLGVVHVPRFLPNIYYPNSSIVLYLDDKGTIRGFNNSFLTIAGKTAAGIKGLFGKPVGQYVEPTPEKIQSRYKKEMERAVKRPWKVLADNIPGTGRIWENRHETADYLSLPKTIDTAENDFRFSLGVDVLEGGPPLMILGNTEKNVHETGGNDYQANETLLADGYELKRKGFTTHSKKRKTARNNIELVFFKAGRVLGMAINSEPVLSYYDPSFIHRRNARAFLGLRQGCRVKINRVKVEVAPSKDRSAPFVDHEHIVRSKTTAGRFFSIARFYNQSLSASYRYLDAYILNDVSQIQEKVTQYRRQYRQEKQESERLKSLLWEQAGSGEMLVGQSEAVLKIKERAGLIADSSASVLIQGPTGTGKEVLARYIHDKSPRRDRPFVKVDCSALPANLIESELFGNEKGAFTGAVERKIGRFEQAHGGTLFLDEVGNLNRDIQAKLLNVLQDFTITRIGGEKPVKLDIRLLSASNISLDTLIEKGSFREDLYFRINTIAIDIPPLCERKEDIPVLAKRFVHEFNLAGSKKIKDLTPAAYKRLFAASWPGNIRELRNVIHRAYVFCESDLIDEDLVPAAFEAASRKDQSPAAKKTSYHLKGMDRKKFLAVVKKHRGVVSDIARALGISRVACYDNLKRFRISLKPYR